MILPLLTTVHYFLYVHIRFRTFKIAIKPNWNSYYNISNVPTTLYLSQMKRICGSHYFLDLLTKSDLLRYLLLRCAHLATWMEVSFLLGTAAPRRLDVLTTSGLVVRRRDLFKTSSRCLKDVCVRWVLRDR